MTYKGTFAGKTSTRRPTDHEKFSKNMDNIKKTVEFDTTKFKYTVNGKNQSDLIKKGAEDLINKLEVESIPVVELMDCNGVREDITSKVYAFSECTKDATSSDFPFSREQKQVDNNFLLLIEGRAFERQITHHQSKDSVNAYIDECKKNSINTDVSECTYTIYKLETPERTGILNTFGTT